jgi:hypothetical protein
MTILRQPGWWHRRVAGGPEPWAYYGALMSLSIDSRAGADSTFDFYNPYPPFGSGETPTAAQIKHYGNAPPDLVYGWARSGVLDFDRRSATYDRTVPFALGVNTMIECTAYEFDMAEDYTSLAWQLLDANDDNVFAFEVTGDKSVGGTAGYGNRAYVTIDNGAAVEVGAPGGSPPYAQLLMRFTFTANTVIGTNLGVASTYITSFTSTPVRVDQATQLRVYGGRAYQSHSGVNLFKVWTRVSFFPDGYPPP